MNAKILVVDDSIVMRNALEDVLVTAGYSVTTAPDGVEGLELVHGDSFDLMFLDIDMPNLSGLQVCRMLRNDPSFRDFPIIMLTARDEKRDQFWGMETGANAYLTKPFDPENLLKTVTDVLEKSQEVTESPVMEAMIRLGGQDTEDQESEDVIFSAGEVQEKQLFKMTLINRIYELSMRYNNLREICNAVIEIYASVIDFDVAMSMITDDDHIKMFIYVNKPLNKEFFQNTKKRMMGDFERQTGQKIIKENVEVIIEDPDHNIIKGAEEYEIRGFHTQLMESKGEKFGIFVMSRARDNIFNPDELEMANIIAGQSNMVIDNVRMYEKIQRFAIADGLTGLYNHRYFQEQLEKEYSRAIRFHLNLSLIILDIDHFKNFNDEHGHQQGDTILKAIAGIMKKCVREIDLVARYGGEEFVVILPETPKKNAVIVAERIRNAIQEYEVPREPRPLNVTASLGLAGYPEDNISTRLDLISKSDLALYKAKRDGRNRVCLYSPELEVEFS